MKFLSILLLSVYIMLATLSAPMFHFGKTNAVHDLSKPAAMDEHGASPMKADRGDMLSRCIQAATFFTTAIPSLFIQILKTLLIVFVILGSVALGFGSNTQDLFGRWKLTAVGRSYCRTVLYLALRLFRKWHALLKLSQNFIATASG